MRFASAPTARTRPLPSSIAITDGSNITIPRPRANTTVFAVPRSIARSPGGRRGIVIRVPGRRARATAPALRRLQFDQRDPSESLVTGLRVLGFADRPGGRSLTRGIFEWLGRSRAGLNSRGRLSPSRSDATSVDIEASSPWQLLEYRLEYRFVSATRSSLHSAAALPLPTCRRFQPAALTCRRLAKTFNPKSWS